MVVPVLSLGGTERCSALELGSLEVRVGELKTFLEQRTGVPRAEQELVCGGEVMSDVQRLCHYFDRLLSSPQLYLLRREPRSCDLGQLGRATQRRLRKELGQCNHTLLPEGCTLCPVGGDLDASPLRWEASLSGPAGGPYEGALFQLDIVVPRDYPFRPPQVSFATPVFHPSVAPGGGVDADFLHERWSPSLSLPGLVRAIHALLERPHEVCCGCGNPEAASLIHDYIEFDCRARKWSLAYASPCGSCS